MISENQNEEKSTNTLTDKKAENGITGSTLKIIAVVTMLIDHIAAVVLAGYLQSAGYQNPQLKNLFSEVQSSPFYGTVYLTELIMRLIGRLSFPLFCFLLTEGYRHTHSRLRYALRLLAFAILSELPFDLALGYEQKMIGTVYQNVFFTLCIGFLTIWGMERLQNLLPLPLLIFCAGFLGAEFLRVDYGGIGVATIVAIHSFRNIRKESNAVSMFAGTLVLAFSNPLEIPALLNIPLVRKYNGKRGITKKYVFYLFYPIHFFVLYLIKRAVIL